MVKIMVVTAAGRGDGGGGSDGGDDGDIDGGGGKGGGEGGGDGGSDCGCYGCAWGGSGAVDGLGGRQQFERIKVTVARGRAGGRARRPALTS